jgi:hypothetical protein
MQCPVDLIRGKKLQHEIVGMEPGAMGKEAKKVWMAS